MLIIVTSALVGAVLGRTIRHLTPHFLQLKDRSLPFTWPWVEITGSIFFAITAWTKGLLPESIPAFLFALVLLAIMACDYGWKLIPDHLSHGGIVAGLICAVIFPVNIISYLSHIDLLQWVFSSPMSRSIYGIFLAGTGALTGFAILEITRRIFSKLTQMEVMGMGDAKLLALIGAFLGPEMALFCLLPASFLGILNGLIYRFLFGTPHSPFGPALALGGLVMLHFHQNIVGSMNAFYAFFYALPSSAIMGVFVVSCIILIFLVWRIKKRAAFYSQEIEKDYEQIENELESSSIE